LNNWLFARDSGEFIDFDLSKVPAIADKQDAIWERANKSTYLTTNEKREMSGLEGVGPSGDTILVPSGVLPLEAIVSLSVDDDDDDRDLDDDDTVKKLIAQGYSEAEANEMLGLKF
jgi:hypothetical protein